VILFIGDGMGVSTVTAIRILDGQSKGMPGEEHVLSFERFPHVALSKTYVLDQQVGESAGTATAILTGSKTNAGVVGVNHLAVRGNCASSIGNNSRSALEYAESAGMSTGIVTTTRLTHATPAAAYAHSPSRNWESDLALSEEALQNGCKDIAAQLIDFPYGDGIEVAMGGGRSNFLPDTTTDPEGSGTINSRKDQRNLVQEWTEKYSASEYVWNQAQFDAVDPATTDHLLGLFNRGHMNYEADRAADPGGEPSLAEMTQLAIEVLRKNQNGYFLLVEGGRIDHAHHNNNAYRALVDGIAFADAVQVADEMTSADDTLIIVTADHSHVLTMAGYPTRGNPILGKVTGNDATGTPKSAFDLLSDGKPYTTLGYQNGPGGAWVGGPRPDLSEIDTIRDKDFLQQSALPRTSESHGGEDVAVYARGPGAEQVHGVMEQNLVFDVMDKAALLRDRAER
jgi:alkaline phosphatase